MQNEKHSIQISEKLYSQIREYCIANHLKIYEYVEHLVELGFSLERYGDVPFGSFKNEPYVDKTKSVVEEVLDVLASDETVEKVDIGIDEYNKLIGECLNDIKNETSGATSIEDTMKPMEKNEVKGKNNTKPKKKITRLN